MCEYTTIYDKISAKNVSYISNSYTGPPLRSAKYQLIAYEPLDGRMR